jgi:RHS repeat-associated protein
MGHQAAGNMTNDSFHSYTYDAEGNILTVDNGSTASYVYDALNRRARANTSAASYEYLYDYAGRRTSSWLLNTPGYPAGFGNEGRIYWDGQQIAFRAQDGTTYFDHQDYLGSERLRTSYTGAVAGTYFSLPWGDGSTTTNGGNGPNQDTYFFAGLDADTTGSGAQMTDHAQFRNYSFSQGRWLAPDPYDGSYDLTNPQSLNRYSYVQNNPLSFTDPSGLLDCKYPPCETVKDQYGNTYTVDSQGNVTGGPPQSVGVNGGPPITGGNVWVSGNPDGSAQGIGNYGFGGGEESSMPSLAGGIYTSVVPAPLRCIGQAVQKNGVSLALDAAGVAIGVASEGLTAEVAQIGVGAVATVGSAIGGDLGGSLTSIFGLQMSALGPAAKWAGVGAGTVKRLGAIISGWGLERCLPDLSELQLLYSGALVSELDDNKSPDVFSRKWLLMVILSMVPPFFLFAVQGDPGRGRAAAISVGVIAMAVRACWDMRKNAWFWATAGILIALHVFLVVRVPWTDKSYPGYTLLPFAALDYGVIYGSFKLAEKMMKGSDGASSRS